MITATQLKTGANFYSSEFAEKIIINKATPKMVWYIKLPNPKHKPEKRISKISMLALLNACKFIEIVWTLKN